MITFLIPVALVVLAIVVVLYGKRKPKHKYLAVCEYWVYLPTEKAPPQDDLMTRMVAQNPFSKKGKSPIGPSEGLLFSDIRLHSALVLRSKNPHVFRPDLFTDSIEPTQELLSALADSKSLVKVRYVSEEALNDDRHLRFVPHMAMAVAHLGHGLAIYDVIAERMFTVEEFEALLHDHAVASDPDIHMRVIWVANEPAAHAETRGLMKKGIEEIVTAPAPSDSRVLVSEVLLEGAKQVWESGRVDPELNVDAFDDRFQLLIEPTKDGRRQARILRVQSA